MGAYVEFNGQKCVIPDESIMDRLRGRLDNPKPNCFRSSWGEEPGRGWVLLPYSIVKDLDLTLNAYQLKFADENGSVTIKDLSIVGYESVHETPYDNDNDVMLVQLADARIYNQYTTVNKFYNVTRKSYLDDTDKRFTTSADELSDGSEIVKDLIGELPSGLFPTPVIEDIGSNYTEIAYPEDLAFHHVKGWSAVCEVAHRVGLELTYNKDGEIVLFTPEDLSTTDADALIETQQAKRLASTRPTTSSPQRFPEKFRVLFRKAIVDVVGNTDDDVFGIDEAQQFDAFYVKDITTTDILTVDVMTGTIFTIHHDTIITEQGFSTSTYDTLAEDLVTSYIYQLQGQNRNDIVVFSGFISFPFQTFDSVEYVERGDGPFTFVRRFMPVIHAKNYDYPFPQRITYGYGQVSTASTKYNRSTKAVSVDGRLKPIQRKTDGTLDDSSTKALPFISISDYPIKVGQNVMWFTDPSSGRASVVPIGLQTHKPLFVEFTLDTGLTSPLNATVTQQFWGPTLSGSDLNIQVVCSNDDAAAPQYDLTQNGYVGLAFLREDGTYHCFDLQCPT